MEEVKRLSNLDIENATLIFRNFRGEASTYNAAGNRNFCVRLDKETGIKLAADGWNIHWPKIREDGTERDPYLQVTVRYGIMDPVIHVRAGNGEFIDYHEDRVGELDNAEIANVDLRIRPRHYEVNGRTGVKAYLKEMYVTLDEGAFYWKYRMNQPEEMPFD